MKNTYTQSNNSPSKPIKWLVCISTLLGFILMIPGYAFDANVYDAIPALAWEGFWGALFASAGVVWLVQSFRKRAQSPTIAMSILGSLWVFLSIASLASDFSWIGAGISLFFAGVAFHSCWKGVRALRAPARQNDLPMFVLPSNRNEGRVVWRSMGGL